MTQTTDNRACACRSDDVPSRRRFLSETATIMLGAMSLTILPGVLGGADEEGDAGSSERDEARPAPPDGSPLFGFLVDTEKCIGAGKCLTACREENDVPEGRVRTWVERYIHYKDGTIQVDAVPETGYASANLPIIDRENVERS